MIIWLKKKNPYWNGIFVDEHEIELKEMGLYMLILYYFFNIFFLNKSFLNLKSTYSHATTC